MNPELLIAHFNRVSDAPDAIPRLRRFILNLAVRGRLVAQDPSDEPASELLRRIQADKHRVVKPKTTMAGEPLPAISRNKIPYQLPQGWEWASLGLLGDTNIGLTYSPQDVSDHGIPVLRSNNIRDGKLTLSDVVRVDTNVKQSALVHEGDLLICARNGSRALVGKTAIITGLQEITAFGAFMAIFRSTLNSYLYHFICSPLFRLMIDEVNTTTINQITQTNLRSTLAPIPPRAEQHRIVAKVDELMKLCGRLEAARAERETRRGELVAASHHYLDNGACAEDLPAHAHFYLNHLSTITTLPEQIPALRRTILSLAVRGQLVPQGPAGESAAELLTRIQAEKAKLIEEGLLRKEKPLATIADDKVPFAIPTTWRWARIGTCSLLTDYGTSVKSDQVSDGVPILAMGNIQDGQVVLNDRRKVPQGIDDLPHLFLKRFDLLYNRTNSAELVGKTGIYLGDDDAYTFASYLIRIRFLNNLTSPLYANLAMNAPYFRATQIVPELQQQCGQANVNGSKLRNMLIPVPPFAEQLRIVAKVDELTALCDRLEKRLSDTQAESGHLLESVLHHALNDKHSPVISQPIAQTAKC